MNLPLKPASTIGYFAKNLESWNHGSLLFIPIAAPIAFDTPCFQQDWHAKDLSPEEQDDLDDQISAKGLRYFLLWGQLSEIVENLRMQKPVFSDAELLKAIQFYWDRDAFIDLT